MKTFCLACLLFVSLLPLHAETPSEFVDKIYKQPNAGWHYPSKEALALMVPDSPLQKNMAQAIKVRAAVEKKAPDEKPPFADYPLFSPSPDAYQSYRVYSTTRTGSDTVVIAELLYNPKDGIKPDYVFIHLLQAKNSWLIQEIAYCSGSATTNLTDQLISDLKNP